MCLLRGNRRDLCGDRKNQYLDYQCPHLGPDITLESYRMLPLREVKLRIQRMLHYFFQLPANLQLSQKHLKGIS